jgi:hypothetical protein
MGYESEMRYLIGASSSQYSPTGSGQRLRSAANTIVLTAQLHRHENRAPTQKRKETPLFEKRKGKSQTK